MNRWKKGYIANTLGKKGKRELRFHAPFLIRHVYLDGHRYSVYAHTYDFDCGSSLHREDGPAIEYTDGNNEWWINGRRVD